MSSKVVYSTGIGRICPGCGWPAVDCRCSKPGTQNAEVHGPITARLRLEKAGRGGKAVTVIDSLPQNTDFLAELAGALKKACGTGGTVRTGAVELNGDVRERVRPLLTARGYKVKG
ncbi:MAG: stress response translation initiation inhibitor YciH [Candidatus Eisenbacteria bacterium]